MSRYGILLLLGYAALVSAMTPDGTPPPNPISSIEIAAKTTAHYLDYTHYKIIGSCMWYRCNAGSCSTYATLELDEYLPDLVVSVYNGVGTNPWSEANQLLDMPAAQIASKLIQQTMGLSLSNGSTSTNNVGSHDDSIHTKSVDVVGHPNALTNFPYLSLKLDTSAFMPYYQSDLDILSQRSETGEAIRPETWNPLSNMIGVSFYNHWGYEFPRSVSVNVSNNYKASVIVALHAADIVSNQNTLHVVNSVSDSCGINCAVANIIEELHDDHEIWQEVYPHDRHIRPGEDDSMNVTSLGSDDEATGKGNYVFVVWRHYVGCIQGEHFVTATKTIPPTQKR